MTLQSVYDRNTQAFIDVNPIEVILERRKKENLAGGSWRWIHDRYLPPQVSRLVWRGNVSDEVVVTLSDGRVARAEGTLVFTLDGDVEIGDRCEVEGNKWEVISKRLRLALDAEVFRYA